jgi:hypothetical protein
LVYWQVMSWKLNDKGLCLVNSDVKLAHLHEASQGQDISKLLIMILLIKNVEIIS